MSIFCPKRGVFVSFFQKIFHYCEGLQISDFHYSHRIYLVKKLVFHELSTIARFPLFRLLLYREYTVCRKRHILGIGKIVLSNPISYISYFFYLTKMYTCENLWQYTYILTTFRNSIHFW